MPFTCHNGRYREDETTFTYTDLEGYFPILSVRHILHTPRPLAIAVTSHVISTPEQARNFLEMLACAIEQAGFLEEEDDAATCSRP